MRANTINELQRSSYYRVVFWISLVATSTEFIAVAVAIGLSAHQGWKYTCARWIGSGLILVGSAGALRVASLIYHYKHPVEMNVVGQMIEPLEGTPRHMYRVKEASGMLFFIGYMTILISVISNPDCATRVPILFWTAVGVILYNILLYCIPLMLLLLAIFCLPCLIVFLRWMHPPPNRGAPEDVISGLPSFEYVEGGGMGGGAIYGGVTIEPVDATCAICLQSYEHKGRLRVLPCRHHFHQSCVDEWFRIQATCPLCVKPIVDGPIVDGSVVDGPVVDGPVVDRPSSVQDMV